MNEQDLKMEGVHLTVLLTFEWQEFREAYRTSFIYPSIIFLSVCDIAVRSHLVIHLLNQY
jgi:hypothetical protein